ncbi:MAG: hypothetical protein WKF77_27425, partial [Planctomycetaceae bacterium]
PDTPISPKYQLCCGLPLTLSGCGTSAPPKAKVYSVTGKVTGGSGDLTGCLIVFNPVDPKEPSASGTIKEGGAYNLEASDGRRGCPAGQYKVTLTMTQEATKQAMMGAMSTPRGGPPSSITTGPFPEKYGSIETSDKMVDVTEGTNTIDIQL